MFCLLVYVLREYHFRHESSVTQLPNRSRALQTQGPNNQAAALAAHPDAGASGASHVKELKRGLLLVGKDLPPVSARSRTLRAKKWQLLEIPKSFEGQVLVFRAEIRIA